VIEDNPKVSIVTPTLNSAEYLGDLLAAVDRQSYENIEHVIIDGESTDGTVDMIRRYAEDHNVNWVSEPDENNADATTKGLKMATGDIVIIVPSDDLIFPWSVSTAVDYFRAHPDVDIVHGDSIGWDIATGVWSLRLHKRFTYGYLARTQILTPQATYIRSHVLKGEEELDPSLPHACDYDQILRMARGRRVVNVPEFLAIFRKRIGAVNMRDGVGDEILKEVEILRARYTRTSGPFHYLLVKWDKAYGAIHRRLQIFRMLRRSRKPDGAGDKLNQNRPWSNFLASYTVSSQSARGLLTTLLPGRRQYDIDIWSRPGAIDLGAAERLRTKNSDV
jgi:glycosyltransferase involved in cell wall biosynthesis